MPEAGEVKELEVVPKNHGNISSSAKRGTGISVRGEYIVAEYNFNFFLMKQLLFKEVEPPKHHKKISLQKNLSWFTWSDGFLNEVKLIKQQMRSIKSIDFITLKEYRTYNFTYTVNIRICNKEFLNDFRPFIEQLMQFAPGERLIFFRDLINERIDGRTFHFLFALFRAVIVSIQKDRMAALYIPLSTGKNENDFPLHCDLFIPRNLWNVFEKIKQDGSGASTFLRVKELLTNILPATKMPFDI
jgi:hypothetical protein